MDLPTARPPHLPRPFAPGRAGARVREAFEAFDGGRKGWLERRELKCAMAALLGYRPSRLEVRWLLERAGAGAGAAAGGGGGGGTGPCRVDRAVFVEHMEAALRARSRDEHIRQVFKAFDPTCSGFVARADLHAAFAAACPHVPEATVDQIFNEVDADGDGRVTPADFSAMMLFGQMSSFPARAAIVT